MNYSEKLKDPRWQKVRLEIMQRDQWACCSCGDTKTTLNVHHKSYKKGREPWEYPLDNFVTLCEPCHESLHVQVLDIAEPEYVQRTRELVSHNALTMSGVFGPVFFEMYRQGKPKEEIAAYILGYEDLDALAAFEEMERSKPTHNLSDKLISENNVRAVAKDLFHGAKIKAMDLLREELNKRLMAAEVEENIQKSNAVLLEFIMLDQVRIIIANSK